MKHKKNNWFNKFLIILICILFSPIIIFILICVGVGYLFSLPKFYREYINSRYYLDFKKKFTWDITFASEYLFYNSAIRRGLQFKYFLQESNGFEYFVYDGTLFLFPDFSEIHFDKDKSEWQINRGGNWSGLEDAYNALIEKLDDAPAMPVKLLIWRNMFEHMDIGRSDIPEYIFVTWSYDNAFENDDSPFKTVVPESPKELFEMMKNTHDLCGVFEYNEERDIIRWKPYFTRIMVEIDVDPRDCYIGISKLNFKGFFECELTHWHPTQIEVYDEICKIGKRGNVMVVRTFLGGIGGGVLYTGRKEDCPYKSDKKSLFGKYYYLEATQTLDDARNEE